MGHCDDGDRTYFTPVYCNSLMAVLNVRDAIRDKGRGGSHGISLQFPSGPNPSILGRGRVGRPRPLVLYRRSPNHRVRKIARTRSLVPEPTMATVACHSFPPGLAWSTPRRLRISSWDECRPERLSGRISYLHRVYRMVCFVDIRATSAWCSVGIFYVVCAILMLFCNYQFIPPVPHLDLTLSTRIIL